MALILNDYDLNYRRTTGNEIPEDQAPSVTVTDMNSKDKAMDMVRKYLTVKNLLIAGGLFLIWKKLIKK